MAYDLIWWNPMTFDLVSSLDLINLTSIDPPARHSTLDP